MDIQKTRHSLAHILASALQTLYPKVKFGIGPAIENGFYYDVSQSLKPEDLPQIEKKMQEIIRQNTAFKKKLISKIAAKKIFKDQPFKLELIKELPGKTVTIYESGEFIDLCKGPHIKSTKEISPSSFKLTKISGAYWRGNEKNPMLTRIYGLAFGTKEELQDYIRIQAEAEKRDHRKLGEKLELFFTHETAPGMPYWLPKGVIIYNELVNFWRKEHQKRGYQEISTPLLNKKEIYETSGHWEHYRENMFIAKTEENEVYGVKAMNCPNAMIVYGLKPRSYRDLPLRFSDIDPIHRYEKSGTLYGLLRVRSFRQDDAHIFVRENQIKDEYKKILEIIEKFYAVFNMEYSFRLGTRPKKFMGDVKTWNKAEKELGEILKDSGKKYVVLKGDGAFYGPKIDILMRDSIGREWQMGTVQLDFQMPKRFNLSYVDENGKKQIPVTIHRVVYGSLERFIGILIEHYEGALPVWLSPVQICIIPVGSSHRKYADDVYEKLITAGIRTELKDENETVSKRIRAGEVQKIPYLLVVGDKEIAADSVRVRKHNEDLGIEKVSDFINRIKKEIVY